MFLSLSRVGVRLTIKLKMISQDFPLIRIYSQLRWSCSCRENHEFHIEILPNKEAKKRSVILQKVFTMRLFQSRS